MEAAMGYQWISLGLMFLIASIWSEDNVRYGYVIVPFMAAFFWWVKWLTFGYLGTIIPIIIFLGIITYLRAHLKFKFGVFGGSGGMLFKIVAFLIFLQFAIVFVNGLALFQNSYVDAPTNEFSTYSVEKAESVYESTTTGLNITDAITTGLQIVWMQWQVLWAIVFGFFTLYGTLIDLFGVSPALSAIISMGIYLLTAFEIFYLVFKMGRTEI